MAKPTRINKCSVCGYEMVGFMGRCPECGAFGSFVELDRSADLGKSVRSKMTEPSKLKEVVTSNSERVQTSLEEFDRVMGGGIIKDSITILTAKPGAGKSTLLLQIANELATKGIRSLYATGEESTSQVKARADRILNNISDELFIISDNSMDSVLSIIDEIDPMFVIVDSIQTFVLEEFSSSRAGSPTQTMECAYELVKIAKDSKKPRMVFVVGQMTKEDELAGVRALEHLVDTVLVIEGESGEELRVLYSTKNRYGSTGEMGFFNMTEEGLLSIDNPSEYFMTKRDDSNEVFGSALSIVKEGTRPILLEIESLVSQSFTPYPSRIGESLKREQLNTLVSILEQRGGIPLYDKNVVIKTMGGIKLKEQASNLALIISIVSSVVEESVSSNTVFLADVGLTGELKKIPSLESRLREADRMGMRRAFVPQGTTIKAKFNNLELVRARTLKEVIGICFKQKTWV
ncbi:MAG: DNA repair protein RadA [Gudongella sp.]|nr:DNA repair protein RadA [Gudongella sp.]